MNPKIVFVTISGYGMTGPYRDMPSHGIAYDVWAGIVAPKVDVTDRTVSGGPFVSHAQPNGEPNRPKL